MVISIMIASMEVENIHIAVEIVMKDSFMMDCLMEQVATITQVEATTKDSGFTVRRKEKEY